MPDCAAVDNARRIATLEARIDDLNREFQIAFLRPRGRDRADSLSQVIERTRQELNRLKAASGGDDSPRELT
jgi:hypothetical protein